MPIRKLLENNFSILAPIAGYTDLPFRETVKTCDCNLSYTEMISAHGLVHKGRNTEVLLKTSKSDTDLIVQIFGNDPNILADAAKIVEDRGFKAVDINMGCPVRKVVNGNSGSALLKNPKQVEKIITTVRKLIKIPLLIKIRSGWDETQINFLKIGRIAENCGVDAICLHPRTRAQMFSGFANWNHIRDLIKKVNIPVIGNGDIHIASDAFKMKEQTNCTAVMIGRGSLGSPWIFEEIKAYKNGQDFFLDSKRKMNIILSHFKRNIEFYGPKYGIKIFRCHLAKYSKGVRGSTDFRKSIMTETDPKMVETKIKDFFKG